MSNTEINKEQVLASSKKLIECLESGSDKEIERAIDEVASYRENGLFQELGKLTRELHDSIRNFEIDDRFNDIAAVEIPDAKERLEYVITMTEQSADKTLTAVEKSQPKIDELNEQLSTFEKRWAQFVERQLSADDFRQLASDLSEFFQHTQSLTSEVSGHLNNVLMAQDFQDLTGQIIRRVIKLVEDVESNLVNLIRLQGDSHVKEKQPKAVEKPGELEGPQIPGMESADAITNQDDVDDLLASLGF